MSADLQSPEFLASLLGEDPLLIMLDIDGTLCEIVPRPEDARVPDATCDVLNQLAGLPAVRVALVTGRSVRDAGRMVPLTGVPIHGNHGFEVRHADGSTEAVATAAEMSAIGLAGTRLSRELGCFPGAFVEHKLHSLSVHHRHVDPECTPDLVSMVSRVAAAHDLRVEPGKAVLNVVPSRLVNKGTAVMRLVQELYGFNGTCGTYPDRDAGSILFAGDDTTDEHAFHALAGIDGAVTVRIGQETARCGCTAARYTLPDPAALLQLLECLRDQRA